MSPRRIGTCMILPLLLAWRPGLAAEQEQGQDQVQQVIKLPLKLNKPATEAGARAAEPAPGKPAEAKPAEAAKPAAEMGKKAEPAKAQEEKPGKAKPEAMAPGVTMGQPPARDLSQPSPEVRAPGAKPRAAHRAKSKKSKMAQGGAKAMGEAAQVKDVVSSILKANSVAISKHNPGYLAKLGDRAMPKATVVACSSPGGQLGMSGGDADLFVISNMGNQLATSEGSVEYGVRHLHTPLLMFVSHTGCGAIKAAAGDYSNMEPSIQKELDSIEIPKGIGATNGALININNQVEGAILKFSGEVEAGKLAVLGGYYDYNNDLKQGRGRLVITNINGETDPARIRELSSSGRYFHYGFMGR